MVTLTLQDMQFMKAALRAPYPVTIEDIKEAGRLLGVQPMWRGFDTQWEAEQYATMCEDRMGRKALIFEGTETPQFWVACKG